MSDAAGIAMATARPPASLRVLLGGIVDYAGLFPPASLDMSAAVAEYAAQKAGDDAWALGRFVLPAARLTELEQQGARALPREAHLSWALSALVSGDVEEDVGRIEQFNERHRDARSGAVLVDTVELKAHTAREIERAGDLLDRRFDTYMEVPVVEDPAELIAAIARTKGKAKIRTGGTTADAFPTAAQIARFVARCLAHGVAFKATAGLHHPWRSEYRLTYAPDAPRGAMFGFLNLLLAVAALTDGLDARTAEAILEERDPDAARFTPDGVRWCTHAFSIATLTKARNAMMSFGSCSFREPIADLRALQLL
jgi:hypothetical protein